MQIDDVGFNEAFKYLGELREAKYKMIKKVNEIRRHIGLPELPTAQAAEDWLDDQADALDLSDWV